MSRMLKFALPAAAALALCASQTARADAIADFYKGKTVKIVYGFGPGGTYGKYSFILAEFLTRHIPGNPKVITQSMPGAGGLKAANYAFNVLPKDGTGLYMPLETMVIFELLRPEKAKYRSREFIWLGTAIQTNSVIGVRADAGADSLADLKTREVVMAASGRSSPTYLMPRAVGALTGAKFKIVTGYRGAAKMQLAVEQGEAQGIALTWLSWKTNKAEWFKPGGFVKALAQIGYEPEKDLPGVPMLSDLLTSEEDKQIVAFLASLSSIGRGLVAPPGTPADRVAALRKAFAATVAEPGLLAAAEKRKLRINPLPAAAIQKIVDRSFDISPEVLERARKKITGG